VGATLDFTVVLWGVAFFAINFSLLVNLCIKLPKFWQKYKTEKRGFYIAKGNVADKSATL